MVIRYSIQVDSRVYERLQEDRKLLKFENCRLRQAIRELIAWRLTGKPLSLEVRNLGIELYLQENDHDL